MRSISTRYKSWYGIGYTIANQAKLQFKFSPESDKGGEQEPNLIPESSILERTTYLESGETLLSYYNNEPFLKIIRELTQKAKAANPNIDTCGQATPEVIASFVRSTGCMEDIKFPESDGIFDVLNQMREDLESEE
jgi:pyruvate-formate lyase-activating enzyme